MLKTALFVVLSAIPAGLSFASTGAGMSAGAYSPDRINRFSVLMPAGPDEPGPEIFRNVDFLIHGRHKLNQGESVHSLARLYGTDIRSLQSTNQNEFIYLRKGGYVRVHNGSGFLYEVTAKTETLDSILGRFKKKQDNGRIFKEQIIMANNLPASALLEKYKFTKGDRVFLPGVYLALDTYKFPFAGGAAVRVSSGYGKRTHPILKKRLMHRGWDIPMPIGTPVFPSRSGMVTYAGWIEGYGYVVDVKHSDRAVSRYGHLSAISVQAGNYVQKAKTVLGKVGSSGLSTGPHLHFEIRDAAGRPMNPRIKMGKK